jgi:hypothetical protein
MASYELEERQVCLKLDRSAKTSTPHNHALISSLVVIAAKRPHAARGEFLILGADSTQMGNVQQWIQHFQPSTSLLRFEDGSLRFG